MHTRMIAIARFGVLAVVGVAAAAVALPRLTATHAAPVPSAYRRARPAGRERGPAPRQLHVPPPQRKLKPVPRSRPTTCRSLRRLAAAAPDPARARSARVAAARARAPGAAHQAPRALPSARRDVRKHPCPPAPSRATAHAASGLAPARLLRAGPLAGSAGDAYVDDAAPLLRSARSRARPAGLAAPAACQQQPTDVHARHGGMLGPQAVPSPRLLASRTSWAAPRRPADSTAPG